MRFSQKRCTRGLEAGLLVLFLCFGCSPPTAWQGAKPAFSPPRGATVVKNGVGLVSIEPSGKPVIVFYCPGRLTTSSDHTSNELERRFDCLGELKVADRGMATYKYHSSSQDQIEVNGKVYQLDEGSVFHIDAEGRIRQLPFAGLPGTPEYLDRLQEYFQANRSAPVASDPN